MAIEGRRRGPAHPAGHGRRRRRARSSAPSTASPRGSTTATSWSPARCRRRRTRRARPARRSAWRRTAPTTISRRWREREAARADGIEAVAIVTPNHMHAPVAKAFLEAGIHVICDKPLTRRWPRRRHCCAQVAAQAARSSRVTHNYTGYPLVRQAREMVRGRRARRDPRRAGRVSAGLADRAARGDGQKQAAWRTDPARSGAGGCLGDIGTHAYQSRRTSSPGSMPDGRGRPHDLRRRAARSTTTSSAAALRGRRARHALGEPGGAGQRERPAPARLRHEGRARVGQEHPNQLAVSPFGQPTRTHRRAARAPCGRSGRARHAHAGGPSRGLSRSLRDDLHRGRDTRSAHNATARRRTRRSPSRPSTTASRAWRSSTRRCARARLAACGRRLRCVEASAMPSPSPPIGRRRI